MNHRHRPVAALALALTLPALLPACATSRDPLTVPVSELVNPEATYNTRLVAAEHARIQLAGDRQGDKELRETVKRVIWVRGNPVQLRIDALDALLADESGLDDTRNMLALLLRDESAWRQWPMIEHIGNVAAERGWTELATGFVVSFARPSVQPPDDQRAELEALRKLFPDRHPADVVFDVFAGRFENARELRERDRLAAWSLLGRLDHDGARARALLAESTPTTDDPLVATLAQIAQRTGCVPSTGEELAWAMRLLEPDHAAFLADAERLVATLSPEQRDSLALRHLAGLVWTSQHAPDRLSMTREEHLSAIDARLDGRKRYWRTGGNAGGKPESLRNARDQLVWADLILISLAIDATDDERLTRQLFDQADRDRLDSSTEHGGVLRATNAAAIDAVSYPPRPSQRMGDRRFVASDDLLRAATTALFHFHFHASNHDNRAYAGPSQGDLDYANLFQCSAIVFTFIDTNTLNADYYHPNGTRLDIGTLKRP